MAEQLKITTAADMLVSLLASTPKISFKDAAKQLGLSLELVETMATFLEEEGTVEIRYQFTTPYLSLKKEVVTSSSEQVISTLKTEMTELSNSLLQMKTNINSGDFSGSHTLSEAILTKLRKIHDTFIIPNTALANTKKKELSERIESIASDLDRAHKLVGSGEFNEAKILYEALNYEFTLHLTSLKHVSSFSQRPAQELGSKDVNKLLATAYESIQKGDLDKARKIHSQLINSYQSLNSTFSHQKDVLERHLVKLSHDLSSNIDDNNVTLVNKIKESITSYASEIDDALKKGHINKAQRLYEVMRKKFTQLPPGFLDEKRQLQQQVLRTFGMISNVREESLMTQFDTAQKVIVELLTKMELAMNNGDLTTARSTYSEARRIFSQLPSSFLERKIDIQSRLLRLYSQLVRTSEESSVAKTKEVAAKINNSLTTLHTLLAQKKLSEAVTLYTDIKKLYLELPQGFLQEKTELQTKIFDFYQALSNYAIRETEQESTFRQQEIELELEKGFEFLHAGKLLLAEEVYTHLVKLYNQMPEGFSKEKVKIRTRILALYKDITMNTSRKEHLPVDRNSQVMHQELMRRFLTASHHISQEKFNLLIHDYEAAERLFKQLPLGLAEQHPHLKNMLDVVKLQVDFLDALQQLPELASFKDKNIFNAHIKKIITMRVKLEKSAPQDSELLRYGALKLAKYEEEHAATGQQFGAHEFPKQPNQPFALPKKAQKKGKVKNSAVRPIKVGDVHDVDMQNITHQIHQLRKKTTPKVKMLHEHV